MVNLCIKQRIVSVVMLVYLFCSAIPLLSALAFLVSCSLKVTHNQIGQLLYVWHICQVISMSYIFIGSYLAVLFMF